MTSGSGKQVQVGEIVGVHGVKGWVKIHSDTDPREGILNYSPWLLGSGERQQAIEVLDGGRRGKGLAAKLDGIDDREQAAKLIGTPIWIRREQLPKLEEGYYWADLVGLSVKNREGQDYGLVSHLIETGANDVLVVRNEERERLIPWLMDQSIVSVDLEAGEIEVEWDPDF